MFNNSPFKKLFGGSTNSNANAREEEPTLPAVYNEPFFYGRITRQESEDILKVNGMDEGLYLLRESITPMGNFSLSIVHENSFLHYSIEKTIDGQYAIAEGVPFPDPVTLIQHYQAKKKGFVTVPKYSCNRAHGQEAIAFRGMSYKEMHKNMKAFAQKMNANMARAFGPMRESLLMQTLKTMHANMPWFHGEITREEGNRRIQVDGHQDGKFLVRAHADGQSFALTLSHEKQFRQYFIKVYDQEIYSLENGCRFKALIILVDHYHNKRDGLTCKLETPVPSHQTSVHEWQNYQQLHSNLVNKKGVKMPRRSLPPPPVPMEDPHSDSDLGEGAEGGASPVLHHTPSYSKSNGHDHAMIYEDAEELENVYNDIRREVLSKDLRPDQIKLDDIKLGSGQFGDVKRGLCTIKNKWIPVAVKTLKASTCAAEMEQLKKMEEEILAEAVVMKELDHPHIVRMIGVCKGESIMLVMELAELGPLKKYLEPHRRNKTTMKKWHLLELMIQICEGMVYLESKDIVHRDLATRNVLLMTEHFAKISDFGLSRIVDNQSEYYRAHCPGRWPLIWYAPECMYYHKFDSKSDVWSFGVTMWEIMTYGAKPYSRMSPNEILSFLERNERLSKPEGCDDQIYQIMRACWEFRIDNRPNFSELLGLLKPLYYSYEKSNR